jgi:hypothetical protein
VSDTPSLWDEGREPGRQVVALGVAIALTLVTLDLLLVGEVSLFFDLSFIVLCLGLAVTVRSDDFFTVGVLPPLIMVAVFALLGVVAPGTIAHESDGVVQAVVTGLAIHSGALLGGYALCLATLFLRQRARGG